MGETEMLAETLGPSPSFEPRAGAPDAVAVSVVLAPHMSVVSLLNQAASRQSFGAPTALLGAVRDGLRPQARFAAASFTARRWTSIPDSCTPISPVVDGSVRDQAARMRDMPGDVLAGELHAADGGFHWPQQWRAAAEQPRRWLNSMADASLDTWAVAEPLWRAAGPLLDREIRRVGTAAVRGGMTALLNSLHPDLSYRDGAFAYASPCDPSWTIGPFGPIGARRLVLVPIIAGRNSMLFNFERPDVCWIGYPLAQPRLGTQTGPDGALATILGPVRASMLQALRQTLTVSDLAAAVRCAPTTATYHLHHLTAAGMITREKSGSSVRVSRTARGDELVDLLSD